MPKPNIEGKHLPMLVEAQAGGGAPAENKRRYSLPLSGVG
jgi:hypothetical protein